MKYTNSPLATVTLLSPNHSGLRTHDIDTITIHCVVGQISARRIAEVFQPTSREASCNYGIGYDGEIALIVEEKNRSWCSSSNSNDQRAITIEVASDTSAPYAITDAAYNALIDLLVDICKRNNIKQLLWKADKSLIGKVDKQNMTVHKWFANKDCPGAYLYDRHYQIAEAVNKRLNATTEEVYIKIGGFANKEEANKFLDILKKAEVIVETHTLEKPNKPETITVKVGDRVKLSKDATVYGTGSKKFSSWVYDSMLYVREISGSRIVVSTEKTGAVTGAVDIKYLIKV